MKKKIIRFWEPVRQDTKLKPLWIPLSNESRAFASPWMRIVRGTALGQHPIDFNPQIADNLRLAVNALTQKVADTNYYHKFSAALTELILDTNSAHQKPINIEQTTKTLLDFMIKIDNPYNRVVASAILLDTYGKLHLDLNTLVDAKFNLIHDALIVATQIKREESGGKGDYEQLTALATLFTAAAQNGLADQLVHQGVDYIQYALNLIENIPDAFYRGRGAAMLFTSIALLDAKDYVDGQGRDYVKEVLSYLDENFDRPGEEPKFKKKLAYPLFTMLNAIALLQKPECLNYQRDWIANAKWAEYQFDGGGFIEMGQYYLMALYNLGKLSETVPNVDNFFQEAFEKAKSASFSSALFETMNLTYQLETPWMFGYPQYITDALIERQINTLQEYTENNRGYLNNAYGLSYTLTSLSEIGASHRLFEPNDRFDHQAPFTWVINHFTEGAEEEAKITLPYLYNAMINLALRMRGSGARESAATESTQFLGDLRHEAKNTRGNINLRSEEDEMQQLPEDQRMALVGQAIVEQFSNALGAIVGPIEPLGGGFQTYNRPFKVTTEQGVFIFKREGISKEKAEIITEAVAAARKAGLTYVVEMIRNDQGSLVSEIHGHYYSVQRFEIAHKELVPKTAHDTHWQQAFRSAALLHNAWRSVDAGSRDISPPHDPRVYRDRGEYQSLYNAINAKPSATSPLTGPEQLYISMYPMLISQLKILEENLDPVYDKLPVQLIDTDLRFKNMFFSEDDQLEHLFDLSHAGYGPRIREFVGLMIYNTGVPFSYDRLVQAVKTYNQYTDIPLSETEIRAIPEILRGTCLEFVKLFFIETGQSGLEKLNADESVYNNIRTKLDHMLPVYNSFSDPAAIDRFVSDVHR